MCAATGSLQGAAGSRSGDPRLVDTWRLGDCLHYATGLFGGDSYPPAEPGAVPHEIQPRSRRIARSAVLKTRDAVTIEDVEIAHKMFKRSAIAGRADHRVKA